MTESNPSAALIIIGNEILSGRTQDLNLNYIAKNLAQIGVSFLETRVIPDIEADIIKTVNDLKKKYDYVFTTGGIGPTHDDITTKSIAKAFGLNLVLNEEIAEELRQFYASNGREMNEARLKMAYFPQGACLLKNPLSSAPGFKIDNVFVMAGIPKIMQAMFVHALSLIKHGKQILSKEVSAIVGESSIAKELAEIQNKYPEVDIGSYPFTQEGKFATSIALRSTNQDKLDLAYEEVKVLLKANGGIIG